MGRSHSGSAARARGVSATAATTAATAATAASAATAATVATSATALSTLPLSGDCNLILLSLLDELPLQLDHAEQRRLLLTRRRGRVFH